MVYVVAAFGRALPMPAVPRRLVPGVSVMRSGVLRGRIRPLHRVGGAALGAACGGAVWRAACGGVLPP